MNSSFAIALWWTDGRDSHTALWWMGGKELAATSRASRPLHVILLSRSLHVSGPVKRPTATSRSNNVIPSFPLPTVGRQRRRRRGGRDGHLPGPSPSSSEPSFVSSSSSSSSRSLPEELACAQEMANRGFFRRSWGWSQAARDGHRQGGWISILMNSLWASS